ncbi:MAG: hypothetical protein KA054_02780, partial [Candidatus Moranbacteria bacterium]|nr:hypothetical protein [Candidatus Moranbacteria bacterium]
SYASMLTNRLWNEAIMVVTAIRMGQFNETVIRDPRWHLKANPEHRIAPCSGTLDRVVPRPTVKKQQEPDQLLFHCFNQAFSK